MSNSAHLVEQVSEAEPWAKSIKLLNPKKNKAKLLGWALLSQNPTTTYTYTTYTEVSHLLPRPTEKKSITRPP